MKIPELLGCRIIRFTWIGKFLIFHCADLRLLWRRSVLNQFIKSSKPNMQFQMFIKVSCSYQSINLHFKRYGTAKLHWIHANNRVIKYSCEVRTKKQIIHSFNLISKSSNQVWMQYKIHYQLFLRHYPIEGNYFFIAQNIHETINRNWFVSLFLLRNFLLLNKLNLVKTWDLVAFLKFLIKKIIFGDDLLHTYTSLVFCCV